jgi:hypothetical protein
MRIRWYGNVRVRVMPHSSTAGSQDRLEQHNALCSRARKMFDQGCAPMHPVGP